MFPNSSKDIECLEIIQTKPSNIQTESTLNNINEERNSPDGIINFINKKLVFKSKFDKKGSEQFLSSKDIALCDVILDDEIEGDENESYNNIEFMKKFTFNKENNLINGEKNYPIKNQQCDLLGKSNKLYNNNSNKIERNRKKNSEKI